MHCEYDTGSCLVLAGLANCLVIRWSFTYNIPSFSGFLFVWLVLFFFERGFLSVGLTALELVL